MFVSSIDMDVVPDVNQPMFVSLKKTTKSLKSMMSYDV